jgi:hypothetical protein
MLGFVQAEHSSQNTKRILRCAALPVPAKLNSAWLDKITLIATHHLHINTRVTNLMNKSAHLGRRAPASGCANALVLVLRKRALKRVHQSMDSRPGPAFDHSGECVPLSPNHGLLASCVSPSTEIERFPGPWIA